MKSFSKFVFILFCIGICWACKKEAVANNRYSLLQKTDWLLGRWENNSSEGNLSESWKKINDSTYLGESYFVIENDTVFAEHISLEERNNQLYYIVTVPNQNNEKPVSFSLLKNSGKQLIFENSKHDFPNQILYNHVGKDSLVAEIRGKKQGKKTSETFKMKKTH